MDASRFDAVAKAVGHSAARRGLAAGLVGGTLATLLISLETVARRHPGRRTHRDDDLSAAKRKKPKKKCKKCGPCRSCKKGKCKPKADGIACGEGSACDGGSCRPLPLPPTCSDSIRNGDETDVDCGGSCPESCANGQTCAGDGDCGSGHCVSLVCRECAITADCGAGRRCEGGTCCTGEGFETEHACTDDAQCCSGNCVTHPFGRTCRPTGCLPAGGDCTAGSSVCCSFTCSETTCE